MLFFFVLFKNRKNLLVSYSGGVGVSAVAATLIYAALTDIGFTPKTTILLMLLSPLLQFVAFLFIRTSNAISSTAHDSSSTMSLIDDCTNEEGATAEIPPMTLTEKWHYLPKLMKYFIPLLLNCLCEYMISQMVSSICFLFSNFNKMKLHSLFHWFILPVWYLVHSRHLAESCWTVSLAFGGFFYWLVWNVWICLISSWFSFHYRSLAALVHFWDVCHWHMWQSMIFGHWIYSLDHLWHIFYLRLFIWQCRSFGSFFYLYFWWNLSMAIFVCVYFIDLLVKHHRNIKFLPCAAYQLASHLVLSLLLWSPYQYIIWYAKCHRLCK